LARDCAAGQVSIHRKWQVPHTHGLKESGIWQITSVAMSSAGSVSVALTQHLEKGLDQYLDVQPQAPVVDVPEVEFDAFGDVLDRGRAAARSVALRPTGHAGFDVMPESILAQHRLEIVVMGQRMRARNDQGHIPPEDVQKLAQF